jgi:hypothetical protein
MNDPANCEQMRKVFGGEIHATEQFLVGGLASKMTNATYRAPEQIGT